MTPLSPLNPPFVSVEGTFNFRSVGGYLIRSNPALRIRPDFLFRSGELTGVTATGADTLTSLGINTAFDLRAKNESDKWQAPPPHLVNVKIVHVPVDQEVNYSPDFLADWLSKFEKDELNAFLGMYRNFLTKLGPALETVIRHLIEHSGRPIVHCTAGKDRTGLLVAVILLLLGVADSEVVEDYTLTEIGLKPAHDMLALRLAQVEAFRNNPIGTLNMGNSRKETMVAVINMMRDEYGTIEEYVLRVTSLARDDIEALRERAQVEV